MISNPYVVFETFDPPQVAFAPIYMIPFLALHIAFIGFMSAKSLWIRPCIYRDRMHMQVITSYVFVKWSFYSQVTFTSLHLKLPHTWRGVD